MLKRAIFVSLGVGVVLGFTQVFAINGENTLRATIAPEPVLCTGVAPQECLVMTIEGEEESTLVYKSISGFDYKKGNTYVVELKKTTHTGALPADKSSISYELVKEISRSFDAKVCSADSYFDGCNTCRGSGDQVACTLMYCMEPSTPSCKYDKPLVKADSEKPTMCTLEYMPVCGEKQVQCIKAPCLPIQKTYGNSCMARADGATNIQPGVCEALTPVSEDILRAHDNGLTNYTNSKDFMPDQAITREQAAKMFVRFSDLYAPRAEDRKLCIFQDEHSMTPDLVNYVKKSCNLRLFNGYDDGSFGAWRELSQPEFIIVMQRLAKQEDQDLILQVVKNKSLQPEISRATFIHWLQEFYTLSQNTSS